MSITDIQGDFREASIIFDSNFPENYKRKLKTEKIFIAFFKSNLDCVYRNFFGKTKREAVKNKKGKQLLRSSKSQ